MICLLGALSTVFVAWKKSEQTSEEEAEDGTNTENVQTLSAQVEDVHAYEEEVDEDDEGIQYGEYSALEGEDNAVSEGDESSNSPVKPVTTNSRVKRTVSAQALSSSSKHSISSSQRSAALEIADVVHTSNSKKRKRSTKDTTKKVKLNPTRGNEYSNITVELLSIQV